MLDRIEAKVADIPYTLREGVLAIMMTLGFSVAMVYTPSLTIRVVAGAIGIASLAGLVYSERRSRRG